VEFSVSKLTATPLCTFANSSDRGVWRSSTLGKNKHISSIFIATAGFSADCILYSGTQWMQKFFI